MKSLNRTLSLVLVLVMVLGMFGIAGATFTDAATVQYTEAVEVMAGIGAINGYADGSFKPTGTITREEAAKMITYAILGSDVASRLSVGATGFKDVDAGRWSAPFISYLVGKGIINGMGDGTFAPTANVTGYQIAKMMLCAAGHGAKGEFTGAGWELAVAVAANRTVFANTKSADYTKAATREEAALYVFNGIVNVPMTQYNKLFDKYETVVYPLGHPNAGQTVEIAEQVYPTLIQNPKVVDGMAGYYWTYKGQVISGFVSDATVLATSKDGTAISDLMDATKTEYIGYQPNKNASGTVVVDFYLNGDLTAAAAAAAPAAVVTAAAKKGAVVSFLDTGIDSKYDVVSVVLDTVSEITAAPTTKTTGATTTVTVPGILGLANVDAKKVVGYEGLAKGDYVMWHKDANGNYFISGKCASFTGTLMAINDAVAGKETLVIDGKQYKVSNLTNADAPADIKQSFGLAGTTFYTDKGGFVCKAEPASATVNLDNTLYVMGKADSGYAVQSQVLFADGTSAIINVAKVDTSAISQSSQAALVAQKFYTFVKNDNGTYNLKTIKNTQQKTIADYDTANTDVVFQRGTPNFFLDKDGNAQGILATSSTVFVVEGATAGTYGKYVGINAVPTVKTKATPSAARGAVLCDANGYAIFAVAYGTAIDSTVLASDYVFPVLPGTEVYNTAGNYYTFAAVVNGEIKTIDAVNQMDIGADGDLTPGVLTSVASYQNGRVASTNDTAGLIKTDFVYATKIDDFVFNGTVVAVKDNGAVKDSFIVTDDCKYFIYDKTKSTPTITAATAADINGLVGAEYAVQAIEKSATDHRVAMLFVTVTANTDATISATLATQADPTAIVHTFTGTSEKTGLTASTKYVVKAACDPNAKIEYSTNGTDWTISNGTEVITTGASGSVTAQFKVTPASGAASTYVFTLTV